MKIYCEDTKETCTSYKQYMNSKHWNNLKKKYRKSKLYIGCCEVCFDSHKTLHLHHKTYNRIGNENLTDLVYLCEECHKKIHEIHKERKEAGLKSSLWFLVKKLRKKNQKSINKKRSKKRKIYSSELRNKARKENIKKREAKEYTRKQERKSEEIILRKKWHRK